MVHDGPTRDMVVTMRKSILWIVVSLAFGITPAWAGGNLIGSLAGSIGGAAGFVDNFDGTTLDNTTYSYDNVDAASSIVQGSGVVVLTSGANAGKTQIVYRTAITKTAHTYKVDAKSNMNGGSGGAYQLRVEEQAALPSLATHDDAKYLIFGGISPGNRSSIYYKPPSDIDTEAAAVLSLASDTYYRLRLDTTTTFWRYRIMSVDEETTHADSGERLWSNTRNNSTNLWLIIAEEPYSTANTAPTITITRFEVQ